MSTELHFLQGQTRKSQEFIHQKWVIHGVPPRSLWVLIALNPGGYEGGSSEKLS